MTKKLDLSEEKPAYEKPRVLASYDKEDLEDAIGVNHEVKGTPETSGGGGCGCGCGCS